jgi:thiol-disulfide isomerase/thioredoxin
MFTLSEELAKPVFINLYATWCPPCVAEMPEIEQLYNELGDEVSFIVIGIGEDEATGQAYAQRYGYSLPFAYSLDGAPFGEGYLIQFIPQTFVLKADGTISAFIGGASDYEGFKAAIEEAMA